MTFLQLEYLLAVADNGLDIRAAAERLETSQPGVRKQLEMLEKALGEKLFVGSARNPQAVTPAGDEVIACARAIAAEVGAMRARLERYPRVGRRDSVRAGRRGGR